MYPHVSQISDLFTLCQIYLKKSAASFSYPLSKVDKAPAFNPPADIPVMIS